MGFAMTMKFMCMLLDSSFVFFVCGSKTRGVLLGVGFWVVCCGLWLVGGFRRSVDSGLWRWISVI